MYKYIDVRDAYGNLSKLRMVEGRIRTDSLDEDSSSIASGFHTVTNEAGESVSKFDGGAYWETRSGKRYWPVEDKAG